MDLIDGTLPTMDNDCRVAVIIPAYDEDVDMLLRPLVSLAAQLEVKKSSFEVLVVVNNSQEDASVRSAAFERNQRALAFLNFLGGFLSRLPFSLSAAQQKQARDIKKSGLMVYGLDLSSAASVPEYTSVGLARDYGSSLACSRFKSVNAGNDGIIALTDCDCRFSSNYITELIKTFARGDVNGAAGRFLTEADKSFAHWRWLEQAMAIHLRKEVSMRKHRQVENEPWQFQKRGKIKDRVLRNGQNMTIRAKSLQAIGGIPHGNSFEDILVSRRVTALPGEVVYNPNFWVATLMRPSERVGFTGLGRRVKMIMEAIEEVAAGRSSEVALPDTHRASEFIQRVISLLDKGILTPKLLHSHFIEYGADADAIVHQDLVELCQTLAMEFNSRHENHGWRKTENLVLEKFYRHLPKRVLKANFKIE